MLVTTGCSFVWGDELKGYDQDPPKHWKHTFTHKLAKHLGVKYNNMGSCGASNHKIFRDLSLWFNGKSPDWVYKQNGKLATPENTTHMVVLWSAWQREELPFAIDKSVEDDFNIMRFEGITQYSPVRIDTVAYFDKPLRETIKQWYIANKNNRRYLQQQLPYMVAVQTMCKAHNIKLIQGFFHDVMWRDIVGVMQDKDPLWKAHNKLLGDLVGCLEQHSRIGITKYRTIHNFCTHRNVDGQPDRDLLPYGHPNEITQTHYAEYLKELFDQEYGQTT